MSNRKFVEQPLGILQVGGVEAFGEPGVDFGEHRARLVGPALVSAAGRGLWPRNSHDLAWSRRPNSLVVVFTRPHSSYARSVSARCSSGLRPRSIAIARPRSRRGLSLSRGAQDALGGIGKYLAS